MPSTLQIFAITLAVSGVTLIQGAALDAQSAPPGAEADRQTSAAAVVDIVAEDYAFSAPDEILSGWTTIRFQNEGTEPHFVLVTRLPEGITVDDYETDLSSVFNRVWYQVRDEGLDQEQAMADLFGALPEWFPAVQFVGGTGITAPERVAETTLNLEPGNYVLECYIKTADGEFHYMEGMIRPLAVRETRSDATPPEADIRITLSNFEMDVEGEMTPGRHTVEVHVAENPEEGFGHNVHVARLESDTDIDQLVQWMNAFDLGGLRSPGPATFLGGAQLMPAGNTAYFTVDLEPGRHLFFSEYTGHLGVLREFTVRP